MTTIDSSAKSGNGDSSDVHSDHVDRHSGLADDRRLHRDRSNHRRSSREKHRHSRKRSRSRHDPSRSHSKRRSKRRSDRRQGHRHSHHDRRYRNDGSHRHRSHSRRHRRKHRHRSSSSSSSDESHKPYAPTVVRTNSTEAKTRSPSHDPKSTTDKNETREIPAADATTVASTISATSIAGTEALTSVKSTAASSLRLNTRELLDQIQKHQEAQAKAQAIAAAAAVNLPKYYNPSSVNAVKLAEQQQKRKLLWSKKPDENANSDGKAALWASTSLIAGKGDQAAAAKFRKLMGIHEDAEQSQSANPTELDTQMRAEAQAELFRRLEQEYEVSRALTHTQRGVGLGFSSTTHIDYSSYAAMQNDAQQKGDH